MSDLVLTPDTIVARWSNATLILHASGHEGGVTDVGIGRRPSNGDPPEFELRGRIAPFAGLFPYGVTTVFELTSRPQEIVFVTKNGAETVPVT